MARKMLWSKIHRATVTHADLDYEGSITLAPELLAAADILPYQAVCVWNVTRGTRLETYAIAGQEGSSDLCINGAAAHLVDPGDIVIIASFKTLAEQECQRVEPVVVFVDERNRIRSTRSERPGPLQVPAYQY